MNLIIGRIVSAILVIAIALLAVREIRDAQAKKTANGKEDAPKGSAGPATEYLILAAIVPWLLFAAALTFRTAPVPLASLCWLAGAIFALFGASVCLFSVSTERKKNNIAVAWCSWACHGALIASVVLFAIG